jgi:SAM-dependent methyltransferase
MYIVDRSVMLVESFLKAYGPTTIKRYFWEREYSSTKWDFADDTSDDCVYTHLERYSKDGAILDMGCGSGNTANEMAETSYQSYLGVDISEEALAKAAKRSKENGRQDKNRFECADIMHYVPTGKFDVILFRESMYHVPINKIKATLDRYAAFLKDNGVLIVRLFASNRAVAQSKDKPRPAAMLRLMESEFDVVEKGRYDAIPGRPTVLVLRTGKGLAQ